MPQYQHLYTNFIRHGSQFAKSVTTHGYAQSVVAATHPHLLNNHQNRSVFGRRHANRLGRPTALQLTSAFHTEKAAPSAVTDHRYIFKHGGLDGYYEALQSQDEETVEELDKEWTQYEYPKRIEWKPSTSSLPNGELEAAAADAENAVAAEELIARPMTPAEQAAQAALAHIDAALEREIDFRAELEAAENEPLPRSRTATPSSIARSASPPADPQSQSYAEHLSKLADSGRYAEIPAVFEAMLSMGVKPIASAYNSLLLAAIRIPTSKNEVVTKALDVYADMLRRRTDPDSETYDILVSLLASRSLEVSTMRAALEEKRVRYGGMEEPGKFMLPSHEFEHAILSEDDRLDLAIKLFDSSANADVDRYSSETYHQLISACASAGRVADMVRLFEHMERSSVIPVAESFPTMITAFAKAGDLVSAVECYNEYRVLAIASDEGSLTLHDRLDAQVYAAVINAYVISDKIEGAMKFFQRLVKEYGVRAHDIKDALLASGFVKGFISRGIYQEAFQWAQSVERNARSESLSEIATVAADKDDMMTAVEAYDSITAASELVTPSMAMLAMSVRAGDVTAATKYWHVLSAPNVTATAAFIEPAAMYAVALIGSGQVAEGLSQSDIMFQRIRDAEPMLAEEVDEAVDFIAQYMHDRNIGDPRQTPSPVSSYPPQTVTASPFMSSATSASLEDTFDPYAHNTDFKASAMIADDLESGHGRKGSRLGDALNRFKNIRRAGRHPRYITYAKLISAAAREGKMEMCQDILAMARTDVPPMPYAVVRYGWSSILDAMVGACLNMGSRGRAEQYHQELLDMGSTPSANTFGLYITTLKDSTKTFDEASAAVQIFHRAKAEGVDPSPFLYNALIGKLGKARRIDDCLYYFSEMREQGIKPTSVTYGTVVNALCRVSDEKFAEELFNEMEAMPNYKARPAPYNSMMQFFLTTKRDKTKVLEYYQRMHARNIAPTAHTYKLLVDTHATLEPIDMFAAEEVLGMIRAAGQRPEPVHYASLIHARGCVLHDLEGARQIFDSVAHESTLPLNAGLYQALFEAMVANHRVADSEAVLKDMRARRVAMTPYIANTLIHGWANEKNITKAQSIYDTVGRDKREPSTYEAMTRAHLAVEQRDEAKGVASEMLTRGFPSAVVNKVLELLGGGHEAAPLA